MSEIILWVGILLLVIVVIFQANYIIRRRCERKQKGVFRDWPIRKVGLDEVDRIFKTDSLGPSRQTAVRFFGNYNVPGGTSDYETWVLSVLATQAKMLFEFGTCTGKTTYLWALNSPKDAKIKTLMLDPNQDQASKIDSSDNSVHMESRPSESKNLRLYYSDTPEESKIEQFLMDSLKFDESQFEKQFDIVFVDASHYYDFVKSDSEKALRMIKPGGLVLWHDYRGPWGEKGVFKYLNELNTQLELMHIKDTSLVAYKVPK